MIIQHSKFPFIISLFFLLPDLLPAANLQFTQISTRDGLSQNTVRTLIEDNTGFIWAGTMDGLNRYDGYKIKTYRPEAGNPYSLTDLRIKDIFKDPHGYLWIKTYENVFHCYSPEEDKFIYPGPVKHSTDNYTYTNFYLATNGTIWLWGEHDGLRRIYRDQKLILQEEIIVPPSANCSLFIYEDSEQVIWTGGEEGVISFTPDGKITHYLTDAGLHIQRGTEHQGSLWFTTMEGFLVRLDKTTGKTETIVSNIGAERYFGIAPAGENSLFIVTNEKGVFEYNIQTGLFSKPDWAKDPDLTGAVEMFRDKLNGLWFHSSTGNIWNYNPLSAKVKKMQLIPERIMKTIDLERYKVYIDSSGLFWITTYGNGLFCYDPATNQLDHYRNRPYTNSPASDYLLDITEDRFGNIWVGSEYAGLIRIVKSGNPVQIIRPERETALGRNNNIRSVIEDSTGKIWVGAKNGNLYMYDRNFEKQTTIYEKINPYALAGVAGKYMWIGTKGNGVFLYDIQNNKELAQFTHNSRNTNSLSHDAIFSVLIDNKDRVWLGSFGGGLNLFENTENYQSATFKRFIQNSGNKSYIRYLLQDRKGRIWAGTYDGVICFDPEELLLDPNAYTSFKMDLSKPNTLSSNDVKVIYEDANGGIWIGTSGGGLNYFVEKPDFRNSHFIAYTTDNGLADNFISGILEHNNCLWISGENGISRFDMEDSSFMTYHFSENTYGNHFNENAHYRCKDGTMLWGSLDGLLVFHPESFIAERSVPEVMLTGFHIEEMETRDNGESPLKKSITFTDRIKLNHRQNTFTIEFASLILHTPEKNKYSFMLENYDKNWSIPNHINSATYKNLPHGKYIFKVKGSNHDGVWNETVTQLEIIIIPPFWKSPIAYVVYFLLFTGILYIILSVINRMNVLNNAVEMEKQLTNHKLRFFTNISHEFRTPLTLIRGVVEKLNDVNDKPPYLAKQLNTLNRNSLHLSNLIDELLEFRKMQNSTLTLTLTQNDIVAFAHDILSGFREMAGQKEINIRFRTNTEKYLMYFDTRKIDKIINNLLSNSLKFTGKNGKIELIIHIDEKNQTCLISVKDNGMGIPKEKHDLIFSRFMQINFSATGTGVGLSLVKEFAEVHKGKVWYESNPEGGSIFRVELSTREDVYAPENFLPENTLPATDIIIEENPVAETQETPPLSAGFSKDQKLLIIEDNIEVSNFLAEEFSKYFAVSTAENGKTGVEKAIEINPDIIICDIMMPEMDGFEVTRILKNEFQTCHIPIILLTAHSSMDHRLEGIQSGADAYILKPFSVKYIVTRVFKLVEQREVLKKRFSAGEETDNLQMIKNEKDKEFYQRIDNILEENYANAEFNVDMFAEQAIMSRTAFYKKIKGITGISPNDLIKIKRMKKGAQLLLNSDLTIAQISYNVGIEDPFYFSKCFKAQYNCSPSQYRQKKEGV